MGPEQGQDPSKKPLSLQERLLLLQRQHQQLQTQVNMVAGAILLCQQLIDEASARIEGE